LLQSEACTRENSGSDVFQPLAGPASRPDRTDAQDVAKVTSRQWSVGISSGESKSDLAPLPPWANEIPLASRDNPDAWPEVVYEEHAESEHANQHRFIFSPEGQTPCASPRESNVAAPPIAKSVKESDSPAAGVAQLPLVGLDYDNDHTLDTAVPSGSQTGSSADAIVVDSQEAWHQLSVWDIEISDVQMQDGADVQVVPTQPSQTSQRGHEPAGFQPSRGVRPTTSCCRCFSCTGKCGLGSFTCCWMLVIVAIVGLGLVLNPLTIEKDFSSFMTADTQSARTQEAFSDALTARSDNRRLMTPGLFTTFNIFIAYELKPKWSGRGVFNKKVMKEAARFESELTGRAEWKKMCNDVALESKTLCTTGISLPNIALATREVASGDVVPSSLVFNGLGGEILPVQGILRIASKEKMNDVLFPSNFDGQRASSLQTFRTAFHFEFYCCSPQDGLSYQSKKVAELKKVWKEFVTSTLLPTLEQSHDIFRISYAGDDFEGIETMKAFVGDIIMATGSMAFVVVYVTFHTGSIFLAITGLMVVFTAIPLAFVIFALLAGTGTVSIVSALSLFLVVGLGCDVMFVYYDFWYASLHQEGDTSETEKIWWTLQRAGKASLATTATTALSFFANLASVLRPLREFGMFMGLCVLLVWVLASSLFLPLCALHTRYCGCRCSIQRGDTVNPQRSLRSRYITSWTRCLNRWKKTCVLVASLFIALAITCSAFKAEVDVHMQNIFPENHNQNYGKKVMAQYKSANDIFGITVPPPPEREKVCDEWDFNADPSCALFWCEAQKGQVVQPDAREVGCQCFRKQKDQCTAHVQVAVTQRFIGTTLMSPNQLKEATRNYTQSQTTRARLSAGQVTTQEKLAPLVLLEWESGARVIEPIVQMQTQLERTTADHTFCGWKDFCFCGNLVCKAKPGWNRVPGLQLQVPRQLSSVTSQLSSDTILPSNLRTSVSVAFGLKVMEGGPILGKRDSPDLWKFLDEFELSQPWAQRNLYSFCADMPANLKVVSQQCWASEFRAWVLLRGERFPVPQSDFNSRASQFNNENLIQGNDPSTYVWVRNGRIKALYATFELNVDKNVAGKKALAYMDLWQHYVDVWNQKSSTYAQGAFQTSGLWVRVQAQEELVSSTILTLAIVLSLAFLGMLVFTRDVRLSLFVVLATISVLIGLMFFITTLMQWAIGPIEVIALIVFIGYAVTYSLHIAHKYGSHDALQDSSGADARGTDGIRYSRTEYALSTIGWAAVGSAITTAGCSVLLLFCTLTIFQKLGGVVIAVTLLSIFTALGPLPAALLWIGPQNPGACRVWHWSDVVEKLHVSADHFTDARQKTQPMAEISKSLAECHSESHEVGEAHSGRFECQTHDAAHGNPESDPDEDSHRSTHLGDISLSIQNTSPHVPLWARDGEPRDLDTDDIGGGVEGTLPEKPHPTPRCREGLRLAVV